MPIPTFVGGGTVFASDANAWFVPLAAFKSADESVTSSTVLQNDDVLVVALAANATYLMICYLNYEGGTQGASDLKVGWTVPASTVMAYQHIGVTTAGTITQASAATTSDQTNVPAYGTNGAGNTLGALLLGTVKSAGTPGNLQMQWAQNTSNGTATKVKAGSALVLHRIG